MAVMVHDVVGLQHASMAIYNAWCDRVPIMVLGGCGPMDITRRRPWTDWVHTALVQGNLVRDYVKWDDQPSTVTSFPDSFLRGYKLMMTEPHAPVYICYDMGLQEDKLVEPICLPPTSRYRPPARLQADISALRQAADWLIKAENPVIVAGSVGRHPGAVDLLVELAELLAIPVIDTGHRFNFPSTHALDVTGAEIAVLQRADLVLSLDIKDIEYSALFSGLGTRIVPDSARVVSISLDDLLFRSWACDYGRVEARDLDICADTSIALSQLVALCRELKGKSKQELSKYQNRYNSTARIHDGLQANWNEQTQQSWNEVPISHSRLYSEIWEIIENENPVLTYSSVYGGWPRRAWKLTMPDQYIGGNPSTSGGGLGYGIGGSIGAALAHKGNNRLCVDLQPDGDLLFTVSTLWTASHHQIPLLVVVVNNRSYYNAEIHAERVAKVRGRSVENKGVGIRLAQPPVNFAKLAESFGVYGEGPIEKPDDLRPAIERAVGVVKAGSPALVDVFTQAR
jgi:thiamine pyrophosphate-dependent acetolactate synthase large subunit-like protein